MRLGVLRVNCVLHEVAAPLAAAGAASSFLAWAVRGRSASVFGRSVWRGPRDRRAAGTHFRRRPSESTPEILEILAEYGVTATFFQCGANVERLPRDRPRSGGARTRDRQSQLQPSVPVPALAARHRNRTAAGAGNHRNAHRSAARAGSARPMGPVGSGWAAAQRKLQLTGVMWSTIGYDWSRRADEVVARMAAAASNGAILCLHDGRELRAKAGCACHRGDRPAPGSLVAGPGLQI